MRKNLGRRPRGWRSQATRYKKVRGKYVPVNDPMAYEGLPEGTWLVIVKPGSTSIRQAIEPDLTGFLAAARICEDKMLEAMVDASRAKPKETITEKQLEAWERFKRDFGDEPYLAYPSMHDIVQQGIKAVEEQHKNKDKDKISMVTIVR